MGVVIHLDTLGGNGVSSLWKYTAINYADLLTKTGMNEGDLAIVYNSQGVWLINRKLKGVYMYQSGVWEYANQELQTKIEQITSSLKEKSGEVLAASFAGNPKRASVVFSTPFSDNNYSIALTTNSLANSAYNPKVDSATKTANGFTISMSANIITSLTSCMWIATKHGEN